MNITLLAKKGGVGKSTVSILLYEAFRQAGKTVSIHDWDAQGTSTKALELITGKKPEIDRNATAVAASVEQQSSATSEISNNVASAAEGTNGVVAVLNHLSAAASDTRKTAETVLEVSTTVGNAVSDLRSEVETFLAKVAV